MRWKVALLICVILLLLFLVIAPLATVRIQLDLPPAVPAERNPQAPAQGPL